MSKALEFLEAAEKNTFDILQKRNVDKNLQQYKNAFEYSTKNNYAHLEIAKQRAATIRNKAIDNLDKLLIDFEAAFTRRGGKIIWAQDGDEAAAEILKIISKAKTNNVVKSKSNVIDEINLNEVLKRENIDTLETDLGQYIQQLSEEKSFHTVLPAMHKSAEEISRLFTTKKGMTPNSNELEITNFVRAELREKFAKAKVGITGANFLLADTGAVVITENEGNAFLSYAFPKIHIAVTGIEKIIPTMNDLDLFLPLLATHGTGQQITVYNHILSGPKQNEEADGAEEMYLVLLDNGRSELLSEPDQRRTLSCIKCGACSNVCPVYKHIGGFSYNAPYNGPFGAIVSQHTIGAEYAHLSNTSTICGKCTEVCPVKIDLHKMFLYNRRDNVKNGINSKSESIYMFFWKSAMLKRSKMEKGGAKVKNFMLRQFFRKSWGERRDLPNVQPKSFNQIWREQHSSEK